MLHTQCEETASFDFRLLLAQRDACVTEITLSLSCCPISTDAGKNLNLRVDSTGSELARVFLEIEVWAEVAPMACYGSAYHASPCPCCFDATPSQRIYVSPTVLGVSASWDFYVCTVSVFFSISLFLACSRFHLLSLLFSTPLSCTL